MTFFIHGSTFKTLVDFMKAGGTLGNNFTSKASLVWKCLLLGIFNITWEEKLKANIQADSTFKGL